MKKQLRPIKEKKSWIMFLLNFPGRISFRNYIFCQVISEDTGPPKIFIVVLLAFYDPRYIIL